MGVLREIAEWPSKAGFRQCYVFAHPYQPFQFLARMGLKSELPSNTEESSRRKEIQTISQYLSAITRSKGVRHAWLCFPQVNAQSLRR